MKSEEIKNKLIAAATEYARKQAKKKGYNPYALGIYLNRIEEIISDIENGAGVQDALGAGFSGTLLNHLAKAVQVSAAESGKYFYEPCGKKSTKKC